MTTKQYITLLALGLIFFWPNTQAFAEADAGDKADQQESEWGEEWEEESWQEPSPWTWRNVAEYGVAKLLDSDAANLKSQVQDEFRLTSQLNYIDASYQLDLKAELLVDSVTRETEKRFRRASFSTSLADNLDLKLGRQVITWGTGDLLFLNDLFRKDWQSFFNGRDDSELKPETDAVRLSLFSKLNFELVYVPEFSADIALTGERYSFYFPGIGLFQPEQPINPIAVKDRELSFRLYANQAGIEWAFYGYDGFFKSPSKLVNQTDLTYAPMRAYGASIRTPIGGGLFNSEISLYQSKEDRGGWNPQVPNDQLRFLFGYDMELVKDLSLGLQAYVEQTRDYQQQLASQLPEQIFQTENRTMLTSRFTYQTLRQTLVHSAMLFYSPSDKDYYLRYSANYSFNDQLKLHGGLNWLNGSEDFTFLGQLQDNSNWFVRAEYHF